MLNNAASRRLLLGMAAFALAAGAVWAQPRPDAPGSAYEELLTVRRLVSLRLTRPQAEAIAPLLQELAKARVRADALERGFYLETADAVATMETCQLRAQPMPEDLRGWLAATCDRYAASRRPEDQASFATANAVWEKLTEQQRLLVESDAATKARLAKEETARRRRDAALKLALADLPWLRNATDAQYAGERLKRAGAVAKAMWPEADEATLQLYTQRMAIFCDAVRRMSAVQYNAAQPRLPEQIKSVIDPVMPKPANAPLMSGSEWVEFIQDPRTLIQLLGLLPVLPAEVAP